MLAQCGDESVDLFSKLRITVLLRTIDIRVVFWADLR